MKLKPFILFFCFTSFVECAFSQMAFFNNEPINWQEFKKVDVPAEFSKYTNDDAVIIDDKTEFWFYQNNHKIMRLMTFFIANDRGLQALKSIRLPESFDVAFDANFHKQGRLSRIKSPYLNNYQVLKFSARKFSSGKWSQIKFNNKYERVRWIKQTGEFGDEDISVFDIQDVKTGDVVQIYYESSFENSYGSNLFYFYSKYPKINVEYTFNYKVDLFFSKYDFVLPINIHDSLWVRKRTLKEKELHITDKIEFKNIKPINYLSNSNEGKNLPHVFVDMSFIPMIRESYPDGWSRVFDYGVIKTKHFEWLFLSDTVNTFTKVYDKYSAAIRKFSSSLPTLTNDTSSTMFFKALCDTFNSFRYYTKNDLFYNQSHLYELSSTEHLAKRRLVGSSTKLCKDILNENRIFYYKANLQDKRYGEHTVYYRAHYAYEWEFLAIPNKKSYIYFIPRLAGVKYLLNELPFYLEGSLASLYPLNFQKSDSAKEEKYFKFIKTHKGSYNENTRTENATVKINLDNLTADFICKESLSGQFSTILRHLYLNDYIDSTISPHYFKRCIDKPSITEPKIRLSSKISDFPFRYSFNCSGKIALPTNNSLQLKNWFSFVLSAKAIPEAPTHDYYFDFDFSDVYNFLLEFNSPTQIENAEAFTKKINNSYFELESGIIKNGETSYLLKVKLLLKQTSIPLKDIQQLMDLIAELEFLNTFSLKLTK